MDFLEDKDNPTRVQNVLHRNIHSYNTKFQMERKIEERDVVKLMPTKKTYFQSIKPEIQDPSGSVRNNSK